MSAAKPLPRLLLMLPLLLGAALALLYWRGLTFDVNGSPSRLLGKAVPAFNLPSLLDGRVRLSVKDIKGPALINVWATWCAACRNEHAKLIEMVGQGMVVYGVDYQDDADRARDWLKQQGNPFAWVMFDGASASSLALDIFSLPQTYAVDANGIIRYRHIGEVTDSVWQAMRQALADSRAETLVLSR